MQEETPDAYADGDHDCEPVSERDSIHDGGRLTSDDEFYTNLGAGGIFGASTAITVYRESDVAAAVNAVKQQLEMRAYNARDRGDNRKYNAYMKAIVIVNDCYPAVTDTGGEPSGEHDNTHKGEVRQQ